nr:GGDEF domain-containing protein [Marinifaba aquimaris]
MQARLAELELEAEEYKKRLSEQQFKSLQDSLTKLPNRAAFDERIQLEFKRWQRYGKDLCLAVADIDLFKQINDQFGHLAGDKTLQVIGKAITYGLRETDFIARYGGEEFVFIFPETSAKELEIKLHSLKEKIKTIPFKFKDKSVNVSISIGLTQFKKGDQPNTAFERADKALYQAKNDGRDKVKLLK